MPLIWFAFAGFWLLIAAVTLVLGADRAAVIELALAIVSALIGFLVSLKDEE